MRHEEVPRTDRRGFEVKIYSICWRFDNPHPLSQMKTELIWEGKYDKYGNYRNVSKRTLFGY